MKVKLTDTVHFSEMGRDAKVKDDVVDLPDAQARDLVDRGLATALSPRSKAAPKVKNKMERVSRNKRR